MSNLASVDTKQEQTNRAVVIISQKEKESVGNKFGCLIGGKTTKLLGHSQPQ